MFTCGQPEGRRHFGLAVGTGNGEIELLGGGVC